jgi:chromosome segregation ATPase
LSEELAILATELEVKCIEVQSFKDNFEKLQSDLSERTSEFERVNSQYQKAKLDGSSAVEKLKKNEDDLAEIKEKNAQLSDELLKKSRQIAAIEHSSSSPAAAASGDAQNKIQQLQQKCDELQRKLDAVPSSQATGGARSKKSVKFAMEPETVIPTSSDDRVKKLEEALETAAKERQEILEAAEKEIDYHRSIAAELESSMINDFEWKLHEIESEYNRKLREAHPEVPQPSTSRRRSPIKGATSASYDHDLFEQKLQQAKNDITRQKDDELAKMHIQIRKEMDDKLRIERNSLKTALDSSHATELSRSIERAKIEAKNLSKAVFKLLRSILNLSSISFRI